MTKLSTKHRLTTQSGIALIKEFEGFSSKIYRCPAGLPTIGYGHVVRPEDVHLFARGLSKANGEILLRIDLQKAEKAVLRLINVPLSDSQFDALVSFTFNLGSGALQRSTLRRKLNRGDYQSVPHELQRWVFANGKRLNGLTRRRNEEARLFMS